MRGPEASAEELASAEARRHEEAQTAFEANSQHPNFYDPLAHIQGPYGGPAERAQRHAIAHFGSEVGDPLPAARNE